MSENKKDRKDLPLQGTLIAEDGQPVATVELFRQQTDDPAYYTAHIDLPLSDHNLERTPTHVQLHGSTQLVQLRKQNLCGSGHLSPHYHIWLEGSF